MNLTIGTQTLETTVLGSSFYHENTGPGKHHFGIFSLACQHHDVGRPVGTSTGTHWAKKLAKWRHSPTNNRLAALRPPQPATALEPDLFHQRVNDPTPHTSVPALALRYPEPRSQRPQDMAWPTSGQALAPRPASPTSGEASAPGLAGPQSCPPLSQHTNCRTLSDLQPETPRDQDHSPMSGLQPQEPLGLGPVHQRANTNSRNPKPFS